MTSDKACKNRREAIAALVLGELEPSAAQQLQEHMRHCQACRAFYSSLSAQERSVQSAFNQFSKELATKDTALVESPSERYETPGDASTPSLGPRSGAGTWRVRLLRASRWAAAAVVLISAGYVAGRASAPGSPDVERLGALAAPVVTESVLADVEDRLASWTEGNYARLKRELYALTRRDIRATLEQNAAVYEATLDKRLAELVKLIEATRALDRQRIAEALEYVEANRLEDRAQLRSHIVTVAARVNEPMPKQPN